MSKMNTQLETTGLSFNNVSFLKFFRKIEILLKLMHFAIVTVVFNFFFQNFEAIHLCLPDLEKVL